MDVEQNKLLTKMKKLIKEGKRKFEDRRDRNYIEDLLELGLSIDDAWDQILKLNCNCYCFDNKPLYRKSEDTLVFKKKINDNLTYIKLKLKNIDSEEIVVCLSFHIDNKKVKDYEMSCV